MVCGWLVDVSHELRSPFADRLSWAERRLLGVAGARRGGGSVSSARGLAAQLSRGGGQRCGRGDVPPTALPPTGDIWKRGHNYVNICKCRWPLGEKDSKPQVLWSSPNYHKVVEKYQGPRKNSNCVCFLKRGAESAITK